MFLVAFWSSVHAMVKLCVQLACRHETGEFYRVILLTSRYVLHIRVLIMLGSTPMLGVAVIGMR